MRLAYLKLCGAVLAIAALPAMAQTPKQGDLLVASQSMADADFAESVLLLLRHDENGSLALLINRPTNLVPAETFPELMSLEEYPGRLFYGGPVLPTQLLFLVRNPPIALADAPAVLDDVFVSGNPEILDELGNWAADDNMVRLYAGHSAWAPGQLDAEIAEGSWTVVPGRADLVFSARPLELWKRTSTSGAELVVSAGPGGAGR